MSQMPTPGEPRSMPPFDPNATHMNRPKLRPVRGFPLQAKAPDGKNVTLLGLADARQISDKIVATMPAFQAVLPLMTGERNVDEIVSAVGRGLQRPVLEQFIAQLDDAALLEGPTFEAVIAKMRAEFDSAPVLPPASTAAFADALVAQELGAEASEEKKAELGPSRLARAFDQWIDAALKDQHDPSLDTLPRAIVVPHIDYPRGWNNYASVWGRLRVCERPDRVVILGTNHFGQATGVCACDKGFRTPLGECAVDREAVEVLRRELGDAVFEHRFDHEREHSIELQIAWIQHIFRGEDGSFPRVLGVLVHDPTVNNGASYDGQGVALDPFVAALKKVLALPGRTLVVSSADLSHMGPAFGDPKPLAGDDPEIAGLRNEIFQHDQAMLRLVAERKPGDLVSAMAWQQNPTRWCSIGNLVATLLAVEPAEVRTLGYGAAMDPQGMSLVCSAAMIMS